MRDPTPQVTLLKDYAPPAFLIETVDLNVDLHEDHARVRSRLTLSRDPAADPGAQLVLDAEDLEFESAALDGRPLAPGDYSAGERHLAVAEVPARFVLETTCLIRPRRNTTLMGLYAAESGFFTQCEAEGFRRITYFIDRPDVMARYTVTIHADRARYPVLLSNGNLVATGDEPGGRHFATWQDPHRKPCYLFAMVAAKLDKLEDAFVTRSGRRVQLAIYVDPGKLDQCGFAMEALKRAMKWDEDVYGLEVDLDNYSIVAVGDFNMGAMENKGLNVFNTKYVLARPDIATDGDYLAIDRVIAHEYFQTGRETASPAATGSSSRSRRGSPCSATRNSGPTCIPGRSSASGRCAACAASSSRRTRAPWRTRCGPRPTSRSTISTPARSTRRALKWCA